MVNIANPIYDIVFKYLMEDERIARTILSALLKKDVVDVKMRRHEYTNGTRDKISMFRIDFAAHIREADGRIHLVLIELQKTWLETETLRFRQYLGAHYANPENIIKSDDGNGYGIPMITVYLLGHKVGDIEEPVLYVQHKSYDYDGHEVTRGIPDPFIDSLVHDSIIVQIPRLRGEVNNRLDEVLSVFDQSSRDISNRQVLNIDESKYGNDIDMLHILRRLHAAASDAQLRQDMNVEDEYFSAIENRDTAIMLRDEKIKILDKELEKKDKALTEKDKALTEKDKALTEKDKALTEKDKALTEKDKALTEKDKALATSIGLLYDNGIAVEQIATSLDVDLNYVKKVLNKRI